MIRRLLAGLFLALLLILAAVPGLCKTIKVDGIEFAVEEDGWYDSMEFVAVYLDTFDKLPDNYLTKKEAQALGWVSREGNLWEVAYGCSIGRDRFGNYEGLLPDKKGRKWTECDIDFDGEYRNGQRIVFSNDGLIYYTDDHYESFDKVEVVYEEASKKTADQDAGSSTKNSTKNNTKSSSKTDSKSNAKGSADSSTKEEAYTTGDLVNDLIDLWLAL